MHRESASSVLMNEKNRCEDINVLALQLKQRIPCLSDAEARRAVSEWLDHCEGWHSEISWRGSFPKIALSEGHSIIFCSFCSGWNCVCENSLPTRWRSKSLALAAFLSGNSWTTLLKFWQGCGYDAAPMPVGSFLTGKIVVSQEICKYADEGILRVVAEAKACRDRGEEIVVSISGRFDRKNEAAWYTIVAIWRKEIIARVHVYRGAGKPRGAVEGNSCVYIGKRADKSVKCLKVVGVNVCLKFLKDVGIVVDRMVLDKDDVMSKIIKEHFDGCVEAINSRHARNNFMKKVRGILRGGERGDVSQKVYAAQSKERIEEIGKCVARAFEKSEAMALAEGREKGVETLIQELTAMYFHISGDHTKCTAEWPCIQANVDGNEYEAVYFLEWQISAVQDLMKMALIENSRRLLAFPGENTCPNMSAHRQIVTYARSDMVLKHCYAGRADCAVLNSQHGKHAWVQEIRKRLQLPCFDRLSKIGENMTRGAEISKQRRKKSWQERGIGVESKASVESELPTGE